MMAAAATARHLWPAQHHPAQKRIISLLQQRCRATVAIAEANSTGANEEWASAKSFESIPGLRSLPVIGTTWGLLPVVGMNLS